MDYTLEAALRTTVGRHVTGLRRQGLVPGVVYGHSVKPITVEIPGKEFAKLFHRAGRSHLLQLRVEGERAARPVLIKELQINPRNSEPVHVDFFQVNLLEKLTVQVPVVLVGEAPATRFNAGELLHLIHQLEVSCLPNAIPGEIDIDISGLAEIDDAVRISEILLPEGVELAAALDPEEVIAKIAAPRVQEEEVVAEGEEGAEETAEGETSAESESSSESS
ncbi:MAG TPA: 50S ribosomal protein L25 [Candidatus Dormibacteraeota bacterium]|nr:50S ribosomal protein L25 [Candidatus Dormibacteraeota bacterium]